MSQQSPVTDLPSTTSSVTQGSLSYFPASAPSAASSRPSTANVAQSEVHGVYGGGSLTQQSSESLAGPMDHPSTVGPYSQPSVRGLGVQSILNPPGDDEERQSPRTRLPPPSSLEFAPRPQARLPAPAASPRSRKRTDSARSPVRDHDFPSGARMGRPVLTPKSPALRAASLGARRNPSFHAQIQPLQHLPTPGGRTYTAEPGPHRSSDIPPLPPLAIATGSNVLAPQSRELNHPRSAHAHENSNRGPDLASTPRSEPSSSHQTPYLKLENPSPNYHYRPPPQFPPSGAPLRGSLGGYGADHLAHGPHEGYQVPPPAGYQMTLDTAHGPMVVPVEMDLQNASKVADEKRKRNAGASARFRQRRKEKEREASQTIAGLQVELRELIEERDFYLAERNHFRDLAQRHIPLSQLGTRPRSPPPRARRVHTSASVLSDHLSGEDEPFNDSEQGSVTRRRRTGDYQPSMATHTTQSPPPLSYGASYTSGPSMPLSLPPPNMQYPPPRSLPPAPPHHPSVTRSQSYDPFRRDGYRQT
ncbi:hypothetical protein PV10_02348 [Exophiala mesophila]|uniref:BZIP domain-containing protein n=1 Tax=Exophiala mesophila TaxID=212818 RepID=A0A0D1Y233_EXOME|nr:uncharacterized protein PV10_02348 [Exophiala mesophila]KIV94596.1 hypothetical protein PV10_02348 [Exophiala mesophila]